MAARLAILVITGLGTAGVILAGCGDSDGGNGASPGASGASSSGDAAEITTSTLSRAEYTKRANAICRSNTKERLAALSTYAKDHPDESEDERLAGAVEDVIVPSVEKLASEIRELGVPQGDEERVERIIVAFEQASEAVRESDGDLQNPAIGKVLSRARALGEAYGLSACDFG